MQASLFSSKKMIGEKIVSSSRGGSQRSRRDESSVKNLIRLSPSTVSLFLECPRCFWRVLNQGIYRPRGIFPSLPGGMDLVIKAYFDGYRARGEMPPEVKGKVRGALFPDLEMLERWRNWRLGLRFEDKESGGVLSGALDDCLVDGGKYIPLDYKTRGGDLRGGEEKYYQHQLDIYTLMLDENGYTAAGVAYLLYFIPKQVAEGGQVRFDVIPHEVKTDAERARNMLRDAVACLRGPMPQSSSKCEYCSWGEMIA